VSTASLLLLWQFGQFIFELKNLKLASGSYQLAYHTVFICFMHKEWAVKIGLHAKRHTKDIDAIRVIGKSLVSQQRNILAICKEPPPDVNNDTLMSIKCKRKSSPIKLCR
jgi:hypothetical protein